MYLGTYLPTYANFKGAQRGSVGLGLVDNAFPTKR